MKKEEFIKEVKKLNALVYSFVGTTKNDMYVGYEDRCASYETLFQKRQNRMYTDRKYYEQIGGWEDFDKKCIKDFCSYYYDLLECNNLKIKKIDFVNDLSCTLFVIVEKKEVEYNV